MRTIEINKPVASMSRDGKLFFNISEQKLGYVIKEKEVLLMGEWGRAKINPKEWIKTGSLREKVFNRPNEPMRLWGNLVIPERNENQQNLFYVKPEETEEEKCKRLML